MVTRASPRFVMSVSAASRIRPAALALDTVSSCRVVFCFDGLDTVSSITGNEARDGNRHELRHIGINGLAGAPQPPYRRAPRAQAHRSRRPPVFGTEGHA